VSAPPPRRASERGLAAGVTLLGAIVLFRGLPAFSPPSLWLDDQWVALLAARAPWSFLFGAPIPCPPGFALLEGLARAWLGEADWALQVLPFAAGILTAPLCGWVAYRLTEEAAIGLTTATLLAGSPVLAAFSLRVKPFSLDALLAAALLGLAVAAMKGRSLRGFAILCALAAAAPLVSFPAIFIAPPLVAATAWSLLASAGGAPLPRRTIVPMLAATSAALGAGAWLLGGRGNPLLYQHWRSFYLPILEPGRLPEFLAANGGRFFTLALPGPLAVLALLVPVGIAALLRRRPTRPLGAAVVAIYAGVAGASALSRFPVGGGRTDLFSYPVTLLCIAAALGAIPWRRRRVAAGAALLAIAALAWTIRDGPVEYPPTGAATIVRQAARVIQPGDGLVVYPWSNWAAAYYGPWPYKLAAAADSTNGYYAELERPATLVLRESVDGVKFDASPRGVESQLEIYLPAAPARVYYLALWGPPAPNDWVVRAFRAHGYRPSGGEKSQGAMWLRFERGEESR